MSVGIGVIACGNSVGAADERRASCLRRIIDGGVAGAIVNESMCGSSTVRIISSKDSWGIAGDFGESYGRGIRNGGVIGAIVEEAICDTIGINVGAVNDPIGDPEDGGGDNRNEWKLD